MKICRQIDKLGRLVIPIDLRKQYGFEPGEKVYFDIQDDGILMHSGDYMYGLDKKYGKD